MDLLLHTDDLLGLKTIIHKIHLKIKLLTPLEKFGLLLNKLKEMELLN